MNFRRENQTILDRIDLRFRELTERLESAGVLEAKPKRVRRTKAQIEADGQKISLEKPNE